MDVLRSGARQVHLALLGAPYDVLVVGCGERSELHHAVLRARPLT